MSEKDQEKKAAKPTKDIKPAWLNPVRAAQAACRGNRGYAILTMRVLVNGNEPIAWMEPVLDKIHPARISRTTVSPTFLAMLMEIGKAPVDNNKGDA